MNKLFFKHNEFDLSKYMKDLSVIDISDLSGIFAMSSFENIAVIKKRIISFSFPMISIFGSGNFHYLTYAVLKNLNKKTALIVFDHHDDFEDFKYSDFLSCGSWISDLINDNSLISEIFVLGSDSDNKNLNEGAKRKVKVLNERDLNLENIKNLLSDIRSENVYLSIDRDIISPFELKTDWDQGNVKVDSLIQFISYIAENFKIIGADICGDSDFHAKDFDNFDLKNSISIYEKIISAIEGR